MTRSGLASQRGWKDSVGREISAANLKKKAVVFGLVMKPISLYVDHRFHNSFPVVCDEIESLRGIFEGEAMRDKGINFNPF